MKIKAQKKGVEGFENVVTLSDVVSYQKDAVVSREIVRRGSGNITLFAFDEAQGLSEHTAPYDAVVVVVDGEAHVKIAGVLQHVKKGQMIVMPAHKPHSLIAKKRFKMMLVMIRG